MNKLNKNLFHFLLLRQARLERSTHRMRYALTGAVYCRETLIIFNFSKSFLIN